MTECGIVSCGVVLARLKRVACVCVFSVPADAVDAILFAWVFTSNTTYIRWCVPNSRERNTDACVFRKVRAAAAA